MDLHPLKRPKTEVPDDADNIPGEQEEGLLALIAHRTVEVERYRLKFEEAERKMRDAQSKLARLRSSSATSPPLNNGVKLERRSPTPLNGVKLERRSPPPHNGVKLERRSPPPLNGVKLERRSPPPLNGVKLEHRSPSPNPPRATPPPSKPPLHIPPLTQPKISPLPPPRTAVKAEGVSQTRARPGSSAQPEKAAAGPTPKKSPKRKFVQREHQDVLTSIRKSSSPHLIRFGTSAHINSHHKRKMRSLVISQANELLFVTSALDGVVNLWQLQSKGHTASLLSTTDCLSPKHRRWPEDLTWHPDGDSLFAAYTGDSGDSQISILNLNLSRENRVIFLEEKPHLKGIINSIIFMPWVDSCFATGGSDHAVILWSEKDGSWKPKAVHRNQHSSAVTGVAGMHQKKTILSAGADKRVVRFDVAAGRPEYKYQLDNKCMSVLPNPSDFNLFMVQCGTPEKQLLLFDSRTRGDELHSFGWKQESSESQSALINQAWSPDGLYISSGSADPKIHIFDIRYNASKPSQSVQAHQKRVFKADWHQSLSMLISISSDLNIGLHRII